MENTHKPILGFAAASGTGKTSLLTQLIPALKQCGLKIGIIKHSHHNFEVDKPNKDSYRLRAAGASPVMLASSHRRAIMTEINPVAEPCLANELSYFPQQDVDLILVEGFKHQDFPKIELHRAELNKPLLYPHDKHIIAVASDTLLEVPHSVRALDLNNIDQISDFIVTDFLNSRLQSNPEKDCSSFETQGLLTLEAALQRLYEQLEAIEGSERKNLKAALGRVLAENVEAKMDLPTHPTSSMDGYAFKSTDISAQNFKLKQVGISWAGKPFLQPLKSGECVRIFTGAVLPEQADSVIMQEQVSLENGWVSFPATTQAQKHVRAIGEEMRQHQQLLSTGKKLTPADLGLLAASGCYSVAVKRQLNIAFFSTGDELGSLGDTLATGQIYDSNRYLLASLLNNDCFQVSDLGVIRDDKSSLEHAFAQAAKDYDVIITTGGASVGEADYIKSVLESCGEVNFWKLAIKPGKPLAFGRIGECYFFGLPGNPASVIVTYNKVVKPALEQLIGLKPAQVLQLRATCQSELKKSQGRQEYQRGIFTQEADGSFSVISAGLQNSNVLSSYSVANCYIVLEVACTQVKQGDEVIIEPFNR